MDRAGKITESNRPSLRPDALSLPLPGASLRPAMRRGALQLLADRHGDQTDRRYLDLGCGPLGLVMAKLAAPWHHPSGRQGLHCCRVRGEERRAQSPHQYYELLVQLRPSAGRGQDSILSHQHSSQNRRQSCSPFFLVGTARINPAASSTSRHFPASKN